MRCMQLNDFVFSLKICTQWGLSSTNVNAIVTDNGANMIAAVNAMPSTGRFVEGVRLTGWPHLRCLAHSLNLVVQNGIQVIEPLRQKLRQIVAFFHRSTHGAEQLRTTQQQFDADKEPLVLINEVSTRWNSTYAMMERILTLRQPLVTALRGDRDVPNLSVDELQTISNVVQLLRPFAEATTDLEAEKYVTASKVIIILGALKNSLRRLVARNTSGDVHVMAEKMLDTLRERYPRLEGQSLLAMPTFLDPRFKKAGFSNDGRYQQCKSDIQMAASGLAMSDAGSYATTSTAATSSSSTPSTSSSSLWMDFDKVVAQCRASRSTCSELLEIRQYVEEAPIDRSADPLSYWKEKEVVFPRLAKLARRHLSMVATSAPSERVFSTTGQLISERRSRLKPENVEKIIFMHNNIHLFDA